MPEESRDNVRPLIELNNISKRFRIRREQQRSLQDTFIRFFRAKRDPREYFWPLRDVSFTVYPGDSIGILGPNGSGKSTLLKLVTGILDPTSGQLQVRGRVSSLLELGAGFHPDLTGRENIYLNGSVHGLSRADMRERLKSIIDFAELGDFIDTPVKHYSSGMYVRLGFAVAIHTDPEVLVVDEVLTVGDQVFQQKCLERIVELKSRGVAIVLVSHSLADVERLCDRAIWLQEGLVHSNGEAMQVVDEYTAFANDVYYQRRRERQQEEVPAEFIIESSEQRWGTGSAIIDKVALLDENGVEPEYFVAGKALRLRLHYRTRTRLERPAFGLAIYRRDGVHVNGPNSVQEGFGLPFIDGEGVVEYTVDSLPLNAGYYQFTVAIYNEDSTVAIDHHHRMYEFDVRSPTLRGEEGIVHIVATWSHVAFDQDGSSASLAMNPEPTSEVG